MIRINGSYVEGGGQILSTALSLSIRLKKLSVHPWLTINHTKPDILTIEK